MVGAESLGPVAEAKAALRRDLLARRAAMTSADRATESAQAVGHLLAAFEPAAAGPIAAYASFGTEPDTARLLAECRERAVTVLLPVLLEDKDLSWRSEYDGELGPSAIETCRLVVVPGLAGDLAGHRLGRGGGSYDRALARVPATVPRALVLFQSEVLDVVPTDSHDALVTHLVTADGVSATSAWLMT